MNLKHNIYIYIHSIYPFEHTINTKDIHMYIVILLYYNYILVYTYRLALKALLHFFLEFLKIVYTVFLNIRQVIQPININF